MNVFHQIGGHWEPAVISNRVRIEHASGTFTLVEHIEDGKSILRLSSDGQLVILPRAGNSVTLKELP